MAKRTPPLPNLGLGPSNADDWATGETSPHVVWRDGRWWTKYHYETTERDFESDRERRRRNRAVSRFLTTQSTDPGL